MFIIDGKTVVTGSFNPTDGGDKRNDENVLIIHDPDLAQKFLNEFRYVWSQTTNSSEVISDSQPATTKDSEPAEE